MATGIRFQQPNGQWVELSVDDNGLLVTTPVDAPAGAPTTEPVSVNIHAYTWKEAFDLAQIMAKGVPMSGVTPIICDIVNSTIYKAYPWRDTLTVISPGTRPLIDGLQDYAGIANFYRFTQASLVRTDVDPNDVRDIDVSQSLAVDLTPVSPYDVRALSWQAGVNKIRLEHAVRIPTGTTWEIRGEYQPHPTRISDFTDPMWMKDMHVDVAAKGLLYWAYRLSDDPRAGEATFVSGRTQYTGQLAAFMAAIEEMAAEEDFGNIDGYFPDNPLVVDARRYGWPWPTLR